MAHPLQMFADHDPQAFELIERGRALALDAGALSHKDKLLIALAIDTCQGTEGGVRSLANQALAAGATKQEILEALRVVHYICGVGCMHTAARALHDVL